jgi:hypothetical protein
MVYCIELGPTRSSFLHSPGLDPQHCSSDALRYAVLILDLTRLCLISTVFLLFEGSDPLSKQDGQNASNCNLQCISQTIYKSC